MRKVFDKFRVYLRKLAIKNGYSIKYIAILEFQKNGNPHLHVLLNQFIAQAWISQSWSALGGGYIVDIRFVDVHRVSRYLSKYLTKELLLSAPERSRRVTTSRSIRLLEKTTKEHPWNLIRMSIFALYTIHHLVASAVTRDEEDFLESFLIAA